MVLWGFLNSSELVIYHTEERNGDKGKAGTIVKIIWLRYFK